MNQQLQKAVNKVMTDKKNKPVILVQGDFTVALLMNPKGKIKSFGVAKRVVADKPNAELGMKIAVSRAVKKMVVAGNERRRTLAHNRIEAKKLARKGIDPAAADAARKIVAR